MNIVNSFDKRQWLFLSSIVSCFIYLYLGYKDAHWSDSGLASMEMVNTFTSNIFWGYSIFSMLLLGFIEHKVMPKVFIFIYFLLSVFSIFWLIYSWMYGEFSLWIFKENLSPIYFLFTYIIALGYKRKYWEILIFILPFIIPISYILSYNHLATLFYESSWLRRPVNSGFLTFYLVGFYGLMVYSVNCEKKANNLIYIIILLTVSLYLAFNTWSRSWILHVFILALIVTVRWIGLQRFKFKYLIYALFLISVVAWIALDLTDNIEAFERVLERKNEDTRTWQYVNFFNEVSNIDLILGQGVDASYHSTNFGSNYKYIDNVFLLCMFRYGILPLLLMIYILFSPCKYIFMNKDDIRFNSLIICQWFLVFIGVSTYTTLNFDVATIIMMMGIGHCYALKFKKNIVFKYNHK